MAATTPARSAAATWLRINASSGDTITVGPRPCARNSFAAMKYTADLPKPVRCTTSARRRCTTSASMAVHHQRHPVEQALLVHDRAHDVLGGVDDREHVDAGA